MPWWICIFRQFLRANVGDGSVYHILREASASLLVQLRWAIPEPRNVERATVQTLTLFLYPPPINRQREGPEAREDILCI